MDRHLAWEAPRLPRLVRSELPRWAATATWSPPATIPLVRHVSHDGLDLIVTNDRRSPPGYVIEFDLGVVDRHRQVGSRRLLALDGSFELTDLEGEPGDDVVALGWVNSVPLPLLQALEVRRLLGTGRLTLVAGPDDPRCGSGEHVATLGFVEGFPINPRRRPRGRAHPGFVALERRVDPAAWRHSYTVATLGDPNAVVLGGLRSEAHPGFVALQRASDGRLSTALLPRTRRRRSPQALMRWVAAPIAWSAPRPQRWALEAAAGRARRLGSPGVRRPPEVEPMRLGHLKRDPAPGWSPLFSASHPVLSDQFITRSELEAVDLGYRIDGVIGYAADSLAQRHGAGVEADVLWASRFGRRRRYREGPLTERN